MREITRDVVMLVVRADNHVVKIPFLEEGEKVGDRKKDSKEVNIPIGSILTPVAFPLFHLNLTDICLI